jgi:hypothetical protein
MASPVFLMGRGLSQIKFVWTHRTKCVMSRSDVQELAICWIVPKLLIKRVLSTSQYSHGYLVHAEYKALGILGSKKPTRTFAFNRGSHQSTAERFLVKHIQHLAMMWKHCSKIGTMLNTKTCAKILILKHPMGPHFLLIFSFLIFIFVQPLICSDPTHCIFEMGVTSFNSPLLQDEVLD